MTDSTRITMRELSVVDVPSIVSVHVESFPRSATTLLGTETVRRYYEWLFLGPHQARYLGACVDDRLAGFCIGGQFKGALIGFLRQNKAYLCRQLLTRPWLLASEEVRTALSTAGSRLLRVRAEGLPSALRGPEIAQFGILAIATAPAYRGSGIGAGLMGEAERLARRLQCRAMGLTVSPTNKSAINFYKRLGWVEVMEGGGWKGRMEKSLVNE